MGQKVTGKMVTMKMEARNRLRDRGVNIDGRGKEACLAARNSG